MTGLPFVFAAWVTTSDVDQKFITEFNEVLKSGIKNTEKAIQESAIKHPLNFNALDYLTNKISYDLDNRKQEALALFLKYVSQL